MHPTGHCSRSRCGRLRGVGQRVLPKCACCGYRTGCITCPVCYWIDDGPNDKNAEMVRIGPNGDLSLSHARLRPRPVGAAAAAHACRLVSGQAGRPRFRAGHRLRVDRRGHRWSRVHRPPVKRPCRAHAAPSEPRCLAPRLFCLASAVAPLDDTPFGSARGGVCCLTLGR